MRRRMFLLFATITSTGLVAWISRKQWLQFFQIKSVTALPEPQRNMLHAMVDAILAPVLPTQAFARQAAVQLCLTNTEKMVMDLPTYIKQDVLQLFWFLTLPGVRRVFLGIRAEWQEASGEQVREVLQAWRHSDQLLKKKSYVAIHALITGSWYASEVSWSRLHYPGPPQLRAAPMDPAS